MQISRGKIQSAQKVVLYGPEGIGKSTFAAKFPDPLFIDTEGSTKHMDVARTPAPSSWTMLIDQVKYVKANPTTCKTLIIDTADWAERLCEQAVCAKAGKAGIEDFGYGKGYTYLVDEFGRLLNMLEEVISVGIHVVFTAHASMRKFEQPDEMGSYDRWEMKLSKKVAPLVREWADMVLFANYETYVVKTEDKKNKAQGGRRIMRTTHHPCWDAKNRHDLGDKLPFDYAEIARCFTASAPHQTVLVQNHPIMTDEDLRLAVVNNVEQRLSSSVVDAVSHFDNAPDVDAVPLVDAPPTDAVSLVTGNKDWEGIPKPLYDLMFANGVEPFEIQDVCARRGYYPNDTPIKNYDPGFIDGVLVGAWNKVFEMIEKIRGPLPF